jgi:hypothetical protein
MGGNTVKFEDVKKWWPLAPWAGVTWLGCYIVVWLERTDCAQASTVCLRIAFTQWFGDVVMLSWVGGYQTLIAGLLAFAAGAFVWIAAREQISSNLDAAVVRDTRREVQALVMLRAGAGLVFRGIHNESAEEAEAGAETMRQAVTNLGQSSPAMAEKMYLPLYYIQRAILTIKSRPIGASFSNTGDLTIRHGRAAALLVGYYLRDLAALFNDDGALTGGQIELPVNSREVFIKTGLHLSEIEVAQVLFIPRDDLA